jgi:acetyl-CoA carboxylase biotin carboxyl carrier protein
MTEPETLTDRQEAALDAMCRNALQLLDAAPDTPARIRIEAGDMCVEMEWPSRTVATATAITTEAAMPMTVAVGPQGSGEPSVALVAAELGHPRSETEFAILASTVGTFYHSPQPGAAPFVRAGDDVKAGQPVGILEVMKLMIPVEADRPGRVTEILVPDGSPVEYGQPLIACSIPINP